MKKRFGTLILALILVCSLAIPAGAANISENAQGLSADNIAHVEMIFDASNNVRITDSDGNDVTEAFISENYENYRTGDYEAVLDCLIDEDLAIEEPYTDYSAVTPMSLVNGSVTSNAITKYFNSPLTGTQTKEWIKFQFTGTYRVNDYNNTVDSGVGVTGTVLGKSASSLDKICAITSKNWEIKNNGKTISFTVDYAARIFIAPNVLGDEQTGTNTFSKTLS